MGPSSGYATCAGREIHYAEWGAQHTRTVIAWHGLARTGRDMDELASHLAQRYRVICPDTIGRGFSQWSPDPKAEYTLAFYAKLAADLMDRLGIDETHWIGTSMGGAIGTVCASGLYEPALKGRIKSLVLNDNAPQLAEPALARIRAYAGNPPSFASMAELEAFFRQVYKPFGWLSDAQWRRLAETSARRLPDGRWTPHYDPQMVRQFTDHPDDYSIWAHYDALEIPVLCLRGAESDLVLRETTGEMMRRGPGTKGLARIVEIAGCGHAPALNVPEQLDLVASFFDEHDPRDGRSKDGDKVDKDDKGGEAPSASRPAGEVALGNRR
jgi:pimeloyl-ACP methyl ester carboxylesterase